MSWQSMTALHLKSFIWLHAAFCCSVAIRAVTSTLSRISDDVKESSRASTMSTVQSCWCWWRGWRHRHIPTWPRWCTSTWFTPRAPSQTATCTSPDLPQFLNSFAGFPVQDCLQNPAPRAYPSIGFLPLTSHNLQTPTHPPVPSSYPLPPSCPLLLCVYVLNFLVCMNVFHLLNQVTPITLKSTYI